MRRALVTIATLLALATGCDTEDAVDDRPLVTRWCEHAGACGWGGTMYECERSQQGEAGDVCVWEKEDAMECELETQTCEINDREGPCAAELAAWDACRANSGS